MSGLQTYIERGTAWKSLGRNPVAGGGSRQVGALPIGTSNYAIPAGAVFVDAAAGSDAAAGTLAAPWATAAHALSATTGTATIVMRAGTYHESASVASGRTVTFQAYPLEAVWFDGSVVVSGWTASGGVWVHAGWTFTPNLTSSSTYVDPAYPAAGDPTVVTFDGVVLTKTAGTPAANQYAVDYGANTLTIGRDPTGHEVRASTLKTAVVASGQANYYGIGFRRYATDSITGICGPLYWGGTASNPTVENCVITQNGFGGIATARTVTIRLSTITSNGYLGITGDRADGTSITDCLVAGNNLQHFKTNPSNGPIKFTRCNGITVARNQITGNYWCNGIWMDVSVKGAAIYSNTVTAGGADGASQGVNGHDIYGILVELSGQGFVADNRVTGYQYGIVARESDHMRIFNNRLVSCNSYSVGLVRDTRDGQNSSAGGTVEYLHGDYPAGVPWEAINCLIANNKCDGSPAFFQVGGDDEYGGDGWQTGTDMQLAIQGNWLVTGNAGWPNSTGGITGCSSSGALNTAAGQSWVNSFGAATPADSTAVVLPDDIADAVGVPRGTQKVGKLT